MTKFTDWIEWNGDFRSKCPVSAGTMGQLMFRGDREDIDRGLSYDISIYRWDDEGRKEDIIAYRIFRETGS